MLVLKREPGQEICIGDNIRVMMFPKGRIGVEAPKDVPVHRKEVYDEVQAELAAKLAADEQEISEGGF